MPPTPERKNDPWMLCMYAARQIGVSRPTILAMTARKELRHKVVGGVVFVHRDDVEAEAARRRRDTEESSASVQVA